MALQLFVYYNRALTLIQEKVDYIQNEFNEYEYNRTKDKVRSKREEFLRKEDEQKQKRNPNRKLSFIEVNSDCDVMSVESVADINSESEDELGTGILGNSRDLTDFLVDNMQQFYTE